MNFVVCEYCGEEEATDRIGNPNLDMDEMIDWQNEKNWWNVCQDCKRIIPLQRMSCIPDKNIQEYCNDELDKIAKRTGKSILNATIFKKEDDSYDSESIEFNGK